MATSGRQVVIQFLGNAKGLVAAAAQGETATQRLGLGLKKFGVMAAAGLAVGGVAAVKGLYEIGETFDDMSDTIRVGTGATGKNLDSLVNSAKRVGKQIPASFSDIGPVVADLNTRMGVTGKTLEGLSKKFLEAGRIGGETLDIKTFTSAFNGFNLNGRQASKTMDDLFRVSQATGVGMNDLASSIARNGPNLKQFGFSIGDSAALIGNLDKAGLDSNSTLATLSKAMVTFAKDGKDGKKALGDTVAQIQQFTKTGKDAKAIELASSIFGTRGAGKFVAAIKSGRVNFKDLMGQTHATSDTIMKASKDTQDFSEKWQIFKNRVLVALEPLATRIFNAFGDGMDRLMKSDAIPRATADLQAFGRIITSVFGFIVDHKDAFGGIAAVVLTAVAAFKVWTAVMAVFNAVVAANPIGLIVIAIAGLVAGLIYAYKHFETFRNIVDGTFSFLKKAVSATINFVKNHWQLIGTVLLGPFFLVGVQIAKHWGKIRSVVTGGVSAVIGFVRSHWQAILGGLIGGPFGVAAALVIKHWGRIKSTVSNGVGKVVGFVKSLPGKITSAIGDMGHLLYSAGAAVIQGLIDGVTSKISALTSKLSSITKLIPKHKGPIEKDRILLHGAGVAIMEGLIHGIQSGEKKLATVLEKITNRVSKMKDKVAALIAERGGIVDSFKGMTSSVFGADSTKTVESIDRKTGETVSTEVPTTVADLLAFSKAQRDQANQLKADIAQVRKLGLSDALIKQFQAQGESGIANLHTLAGGTTADIGNLNAYDKATTDALGATGNMVSGYLGVNDQIKKAQRDEKAAARLEATLEKIEKHLGKGEVATVTIDNNAIVVAIRKEERKKGKKLLVSNP
jgi:TP901 family phage tail tape measure protein